MQLPETLSRTLDMLVTQLVYIFRSIGISEDELVTAIRQSYSAAPPHSPAKPPDFSLTRQANFLMASLISNWNNNPLFADSMGNPKLLTRHGDCSIDSLYQVTAEHEPSGARDIDVEEALRRLLDHAVAEEVADGHYRLLKAVFPSSTDGAVGALAQLNYIGDYVHTGAHNLAYGGATGRFQRVANASGFPAKHVPTLDAIVEEHGMEFLRFVDAFIEEKKLEDVPGDEEKYQVGVGVYLYVLDPPDYAK